MADMTRTVGASPADHTTIASAMSYIITNFNGGSGYTGSDVATIQLIDAAEYNESNVTLGGISGTPSTTSYLKIEATASVKHDGTYNTSKARVRGNTNGQHVFTVSDDYVHVKNLAIMQDSTGTSDECIRVTGDNCLVEKTVFVLDNNTSQQDCLYTNAAITLNAFDCVFRNGGNITRAAINMQISTAITATLYAEHCTVDCNDSFDNEETGISARAQDASSVVNMNINNCAVFDNENVANSDCYNEMDTIKNGTINWSGDGNISSDTSAETRFGATINFDSVTLTSTDASGDQYYVESLTGGSEDYQLKDGSIGVDVAIGAAVSGATRDSRIDLTLDVAGNSRPGTYTDRDIGAFEIVPTGGSGNPWNYYVQMQ